MPTQERIKQSDLDRIKQKIMRLVQCSDEEAEVAAGKVCRDTATLQLLNAACAGSAIAAVESGKAAGVALSTGAGALAALPMGAVSIASAAAAKRFCQALVRHGIKAPLREGQRDILERDLVIYNR